jgi:hypothetical protein
MRAKERKKEEKWGERNKTNIKDMRKERKTQTWRGGMEERGQDK